MKTPEEPNALKEEVENLKEKLSAPTEEEMKTVTGGAAQTGYRYSFRAGDYVYECTGPNIPDKDAVRLLYDVDTNDRHLILHCKRLGDRSNIDMEAWRFLFNYETYGGFLRIMGK